MTYKTIWEIDKNPGLYKLCISSKCATVTPLNLKKNKKCIICWWSEFREDWVRARINLEKEYCLDENGKYDNSIEINV